MATRQQRAYAPGDVARFFSGDRTNDDYRYGIPSGQAFSREDTALRVEGRHDAVALGRFARRGLHRQAGCGFQRGRIGDAAIRPRVALVLTEAMPWLSPGFEAGLAPPMALRVGQTWAANLDQAALAGGRARALTAEERRIEAEQTQQRSLDRALQRRLKAAQTGAAISGAR